MEAAYDQTNSNSAFDNDPSHFKYSSMDDEFNVSPSMPVPIDSECQIMAPPTLAKMCYNESNDMQITDESADVVDNHQRFEDDFGPETDVDAMDETTSLKFTVESEANENNNELCVSNGIKALSLENKIIQQLSEQNQDLFTDSNPFKTDHFDEFSDEPAILDQTTKVSDDCPEEVVDNKIIDALESLVVSNGENEKHELDEGKQEEDLLDIRRQSPDIPDSTEKADYIHEKNLFMLDSATKPEDTFMQHSVGDFIQTEDEKPSMDVQDNTSCLADTKCVDECVGEESEEEEDEWNYIQGDKKSEENHNLCVDEPSAVIEESLIIQSSESVVDVIDSNVAEVSSEPQLLELDSVDILLKEEGEKDHLAENEKIDEPKQDLEETTHNINTTEEPEPNKPEIQAETITPVSIEQELTDYENNGSAIEANDTPLDAELNLTTTSNLLLEASSDLDVVRESLSTLNNCENEQPLDTVEKDTLLPDSIVEETSFSEIVTEHTPSMSVVVEDTPSTEVLEVELPTEEEVIVEKESDIAIETDVEEELERPDSLSLEMASKLNPEAKEFVPVSSPTRSNPTSPVANAPTTVPNLFLMLDDDTVVAQSPKKFTTTMDNIDVPAEDDFQHEMNSRPHELEKPSEYINGNADISVRSHSPISEPSYQELNLKEAMQADEKLEHDYNDEKQVITEDSPSEIVSEENILNVLNKEQDKMNMSFYEGRDDALLSNSDELNKVHVLPEDEDENGDPSNTDDTDKVHMDEQEFTPTNNVHSFEEKIEIMESENTSQPPCEEENLLQNSYAPEEPSTAIYAVASQVVNDVAALVDQLQIESPLVDETELNDSEDTNKEVPVEIPIETTSDEIISNVSRDILVSLEHQNEIKPVEDCIDPHAESPSPNLIDNIRTTETEEMVSPVVESLQQEVVAENEFITDESVINVQPISQSTFSTEVTEPKMEESIKAPITTDDIEHMAVEPVTECIDNSTTINLLEKDTATIEQSETIPLVDKISEDLKPVVAVTKAATTKPTAKTSTTTKPTASKTTTAKTAKPASSILEKKSTTLKATPTKPSTASKPSTSTLKKPSTVSSASSTRTSGGAKPTASSAISRSSAVGSAVNKVATEKKTPLPIKKPATSTLNGEAKATPAPKKPITATTTLKSTTLVKSSTTSSGSARPSSTTVRSAPAKTASTATKPAASAPTKSGTATTTRTSSTVPTAKPRTTPSATSKVSTSATSTTTSTSRTSSSTITKRFSTVGTTASKTTSLAATTKTTASKPTNPVANRTSAVSKLSSTPASGIRKTTTASPIKKSAASPISKNNKAPLSTKTAGGKHVNGKVSTEDSAKNDLLDLDKHIKNDNNQLITNNGIDTQMMVIDSAAD